MEIKFRDGMKSLYTQDFQKKRITDAFKSTHKAGQTARFTSPMFLKTEYTDYYKPYKVKHVPQAGAPAKDKPLV